jgi:hypothetical protein
MAQAGPLDKASRFVAVLWTLYGVEVNGNGEMDLQP